MVVDLLIIEEFVASGENTQGASFGSSLNDAPVNLNTSPPDASFQLLLAIHDDLQWKPQPKPDRSDAIVLEGRARVASVVHDGIRVQSTDKNIRPAERSSRAGPRPHDSKNITNYARR